VPNLTATHSNFFLVTPPGWLLSGIQRPVSDYTVERFQGGTEDGMVVIAYSTGSQLSCYAAGCVRVV
jgi:hypothetical protein